MCSESRRDTSKLKGFQEVVLSLDTVIAGICLFEDITVDIISFTKDFRVVLLFTLLGFVPDLGLSMAYLPSRTMTPMINFQ